MSSSPLFWAKYYNCQFEQKNNNRQFEQKINNRQLEQKKTPKQPSFQAKNYRKSFKYMIPASHSP
jgi:hypothetical protein